MIQFSTHIREIQVYGRLINRLIMSKHCNQITYNKRTYSTETKKPRSFPDYDIVYTFPYITRCSMLNKTKRNLTVITGISSLACVCLQLSDFIPTNDCLLFIGFSCTLTTTIHAITLLCNNIIGFVYFKKEDQKVIISYSNYWGDRINLKADVQDVLPLSETPSNVCSYIYRTVNVKSCKQKLKLSILYGQILKRNHFSNIFCV